VVAPVDTTQASSVHLDAENNISGGVKHNVEDQNADDDDSPWEVSSESEAGNTDNYPIRGPMVTTTGGSSALGEDTEPLVGFATSLELIDHIVSCLWRLPIRRPAPPERINGSTSASTPYQSFDIIHVIEKFPMIEKELAVRLGRMISRRQQLLQYRDRHAMELRGRHLMARRPVMETHSSLGEDGFEDIPSFTALTQHTRDTKATTLIPDQQNPILLEIGESFTPVSCFKFFINHVSEW
jgi:hypothetical protein